MRLVYTVDIFGGGEIKSLVTVDLSLMELLCGE